MLDVAEEGRIVDRPVEDGRGEAIEPQRGHGRVRTQLTAGRVVAQRLSRVPRPRRNKACDRLGRGSSDNGRTGPSVGDSQSDRVRASHGRRCSLVVVLQSAVARARIGSGTRGIDPSLGPGSRHRGDYFRRAFLGLVLARCDRTATIGYGTTFPRRARPLPSASSSARTATSAGSTSRMARSSGRVAICQAALALTGRVTPQCKCANRLAIWLK